MFFFVLIVVNICDPKRNFFFTDNL